MNRFFKTLFRNIRKNPLYSFINLFGLILGFSCIILIAIWIQNELSYDKFHKNSEEIYRVHRYFYDPDGKENLHLEFVAPPVAPMLEKEIKEIEHIARMYHMDFNFAKGDHVSQEYISFAEPEILEIFSFEGLPNDENLLKEPMTMIISDNQAMRYFNRLDVIGETIEFTDETGKTRDLKITGVFKKWNKNSHFHPEFLVSFITFRSYAGEEEMQEWGSNNYETFALIPHLPVDINGQLDNAIDKYLNNGTNWTKIRLENLTDIHFNWHSDKSYVYILVSISLLILIIGSINYMNLNVAMYTRRLEEIKMKKIMGASQKKLTIQMIAESVLFCLVALVFATWIVWMIIPEFNKIIGNPILFNPGDNVPMIIGFVLLTSLTGILSVIYPSIVLSSFKPVSTKIKEGSPVGKTKFRTGLVVFQFFVSIALIISFMIVFKQLSYVHDKNLGLDQENVIILPTTPQLLERLDVFRQQLVSNPNILQVSASKRVPSYGLWDSNGAEIVSDGEVSPLGFRLPNVRADEHFLSTYKIKLIAGRNFDGKNPGYSSYLINEAAVRQIGWKSPEEAIGQVIRYGGMEGNVIGVIGDFHYESLHFPISPILVVNDPSSFNRISIRVTPNNRKETLALIEDTWQQYNIPNYSFSYRYLDDSYNQLYRGEENMKTLLTYFMAIAISIAILGLIGLSVFMIQRRVKEIGVRKVNGAKVWEVMALLNKDFVKWIAIAFVIACPLAWYAMTKWLENFAYKTELSWWVFVLAGVLTLGIALLTVSWQSWKAATRNPVEALRYE